MKKKFNIVDGVILVIALALIAALVLFYFNINSKKADGNEGLNTVKLGFDIEVINLSKEAAEFFDSSVNKSVQFGKTSTGTGIIEKIEILPYKIITSNQEDGEYLMTEIPDKYTVKVTIVSDVIKTADSYKSGDEVISVGTLMPFNSYGIASEDGYIVDLAEVE